MGMFMGPKTSHKGQWMSKGGRTNGPRVGGVTVSRAVGAVAVSQTRAR